VSTKQTRRGGRSISDVAARDDPGARRVVGFCEGSRPRDRGIFHGDLLSDRRSTQTAGPSLTSMRCASPQSRSSE
jgi:hypothetical protein